MELFKSSYRREVVTVAAKKGMRIVTRNGNAVQVSETTEVSETTRFSWELYEISGQHCKFGDNTRISTESFGDSVIVGADTVIDERVEVGNSVQIGTGCLIHGNAVVGSEVTIGNNVTIGGGARIKRGVYIPDDWEIPGGLTVNPGPDGFPMVMPSPPQSFRCNVQGTLRTHY